MRAALTVLAALALSSSVAAQSVSPMEVSVGSLEPRFVARLDVANPYDAARRFQIIASDENHSPVDAWISAPVFDLPPSGRRRVVVSAAFDGAPERKLLICAETIALETASRRVRGQVCSRVTARRY